MHKLLQKSFFYPLACTDVARVLLSPSGWRSSCHHACPSVVIPPDFFAINIASREEPEYDAYVLERLQELHIKHVRVGYTCSSPGTFAQRFLDLLLERGYAVTLVILPEPGTARSLLTDHTRQEEWRTFVTQVFSQYAHRVEYVEVGATPNRQKWSGHSWRSYLQAWAIVCNEAKQYQVKLAGPNVQDFEPITNIVLLGAMRRIGQVPQVHTDNLFVERTVEPDAYDHRALGRWATHIFKFNLVKKARILRHIGHHFGSSKMFSTCSFWSTKRLSRWSDSPQEKKSDYLVRYLILAAASCGLERVYWGPLICHRDGLIDDRCTTYPEVDQSTFYRRICGTLNDLEIMPAFHAYAHLVARLSHSFCANAINNEQGLSHFCFTDAKDNHFHVCWCRDGQNHFLNTLYSENQLQDATFSNVCGDPVPQPQEITESPLFIHFPAWKFQQLPEYFSTTPGVYAGIVYACLPQMQSLPWESQAWRGAFTLTPDISDYSLGDKLQPEHLVKAPELAVLRDSRNRLWNIAHPKTDNKILTVKLNRPTGLKRLSYIFTPSKGRRHWNNASTMLQRGISTPMPIAFYERHSLGGIKLSYYVCEFIPATFSSRHVCSAIEAGEEQFKGLRRDEWFDFLATFICSMHDAGIVHRDLSVGNLMLKQENDGSITPYLIDIGRARIGDNPLPGRKRVLDLMRICYKLSWPNRERLMKCYENNWGKHFHPYWRLMVGYYDVKQGGKKSLKQKIKKKKQT
ncbi:MAG: lipopolysaccharide kinase InaA family protein [Desulfuromonadaceae bacterium]